MTSTSYPVEIAD